ncbi:ABC transporter substrate-binding protein [Streptomyces griseofuscus]|uniref:ABC transporter substrate-binding protein n=1 Tax=Streptomyces griseofuscus TaxID=146922 RepID=UPI001FD32D3F|nr:ABC transporter substrate-binding protein [Streptomyces griseofuscus]
MATAIGPDAARVRSFAQAFRRRYGRAPALWAAEGYDAANLLIHRLTAIRGQRPAREALIAPLRAATYRGISRDFSFDQKMLQLSTPASFVHQVRDGAFHYLGPAPGQGATAEEGVTVRPLTAQDPVSVGGHRLLARIGAGGMGVVHLARSEGGALAALKVIRAEHAADPGFRARFRREAQAAARVDGRWTAPVTAADPEAAEPWIATAFVPGPSLAETVAGYGPLPRTPY